MGKIKKVIEFQKASTVMDYIKLYQILEKLIGKEGIKSGKKVRIAMLSSFTINGFKEILFVKCCEIGIIPEIYVGGYNEYAQEILDKGSQLYKFNPELIIIFINTLSLFGDGYLLPYSVGEKDRIRMIDDKLKDIFLLVDNVKENSSAIILLHDFEIPYHSPLGIVENKQAFGFVESVEKLNRELKNKFKDDSRVYIFNYDSFCSKIGKLDIMDYRMYYLGDIRVNFQYMPKLIEEYLSYIKPLLSMNRKCIVLDLDNTIWGGIIGEDGLEGIKLGPTSEGRPFWELQKYLLSLFNRGIIFAVNSKNNLNDVLDVFKKHPYMVLKEEHFASMQINWNDKISNLRVIAEEINIGMDSIVYLDDDKLNREMVKSALPDVLVVDLPEDPSLYLKTVMEMNDFNVLKILEEDIKKGKIYAQQRMRKEFEKTAGDVTEYLKGLGMVLTIEKANAFNVPRIAQLTQKTNQFNMTTKRYMEEEIKKISVDDNFLVFSVKVEDKFGDNGIVGAFIIEKRKECWKLDTFLLSCRVIGRKIEECVLSYIINKAKEGNVKKLLGEFIHTKKNVPAKDFYKNNGFLLLNNDKQMEAWLYDLQKEYHAPRFIRVVIKS